MLLRTCYCGVIFYRCLDWFVCACAVRRFRLNVSFGCCWMDDHACQIVGVLHQPTHQQTTNKPREVERPTTNIKKKYHHHLANEAIVMDCLQRKKAPAVREWKWQHCWRMLCFRWLFWCGRRDPHSNSVAAASWVSLTWQFVFVSHPLLGGGKSVGEVELT